MTAVPTEQILQHLWPEAGAPEAETAYAILDVARDDRICDALVAAGVSYCCLYRGALTDELAKAAPYLVALQPDAAFTRWIVEEGWGKSWGILFTSTGSLAELRRHFRRFLMVQREDGSTLYFRYYDPRVLRIYLPTCNERELQFVFGPVRRYVAASEDASTMLLFSLSARGLKRDVVPLDAFDPPA